ncbi:MAG TPA: hypothetical protein VFF31_23695 [Blastocatellia bacterium]|nr:hypothetical protein [Blastocatellia bacterium]
MKIVSGNLHDAIIATYQTLELARLNQTLKESGVADIAVRREICERYFFDSGYFIDSCWLSEQGRRFQPGIYFTEVEADERSSGTIFLPDSAVGTILHEYAHDAAAWLFDDHDEDPSEIEVGSINEV